MSMLTICQHYANIINYVCIKIKPQTQSLIISQDQKMEMQRQRGKRMSVTYFGGDNSLFGCVRQLKQPRQTPTSNNHTLSFTSKNAKNRCKSDLSFRDGIGHCKIDSDVLHSEQIVSKSTQKQFPLSQPSHPFFHKSKYSCSLSHSLKSTLQPGGRPRAYNPVIVKSPLQGVLKAKSTHIRKSKLQQYYINLEGDGEMRLVLGSRQNNIQLSGCENVQVFHQHHQIKRRMKKKAEIKHILKKNIQLQSQSELMINHQLSKTKTLQSISCSEPIETHAQAKQSIKYLFRDKSNEKTGEEHDRSLMESVERECTPKSNILRDNLHNSMFLKERINVKRGQMYKRAKKSKDSVLFAISEDFDLKPWVNHKLEDKENELAF